jgi:hypothetical protein
MKNKYELLGMAVERWYDDLCEIKTRQHKGNPTSHSSISEIVVLEKVTPYEDDALFIIEHMNRVSDADVLFDYDCPEDCEEFSIVIRYRNVNQVWKNVDK